MRKIASLREINQTASVRPTSIRSFASAPSLPPVLIGLTVVTGPVDAASYLTRGHVFTANMTGNMVFLAFALAHCSIISGLCAIRVSSTRTVDVSKN